jgi:Flp pilus assembly protein TadD
MYILALMSKPTSLPLPAVMLLLDYWPLKRLNRKAILEKLPFFAVAALFAVITYISQSRAAATVLPTQYGPQRIPLILCHNIIFYLYKIIWPANLSPHYAFPEPLSPANPLILAGIIGTAILLPLMLISLRWTPAILSGWLFFLIAILPTMGVIGFTNVIAADKFAYLPSLGLLMLLTSLLSWLRSTNTTAMLVARKTAIALAVLVLASAEAIATRRYLEHWQDTVRLCQHILTLTPNAARIHSQLALALKSQGKLDDAVAQYNEALRISPDYPNAHNDLGAVLARQGKLAQAIAHYNIALKLDPHLYQAHYNLADVLAQQGWLDEAVTHYTEALRINPELPSAHSSLATVLIQRGKFNEAVAHLTEALRIKPDSPDAHNNLGYILMHQGKLAQAITHFTEALRTRPDFANAHHNFGYALTRQGRLDEAVTHYTEALHIKPDFPEVHNDLAVILVRLGKLDDALNHYHQALQIRPDYPQPMTGIAHILINHPNPEKRDISNAIQLAEHAADLTRYQNPAILDTLAAAYAAQGRFDIAITTAQTALDLATAQKADELAAHIRTRLELYRQAKPHLQPQPSQNQIHP